MRNNGKKFILFLVFVFLGILIAVQLRTIWTLNRQKVSAVMRVEQLQANLQDWLDTEQMLKESIDKLEKEKDDLLKQVADAKNDPIMTELIRARDADRVKAGLTDVKGPGITIKLDDALVRTTDNPNDQLIHDIDIYRTLNVLKNAGAQALAVNGERVLSTSEQTCAGTTILVNKKRYAVPYVITAIGDPAAMEKAFYESPVVFIMNQNKIRIEVSTSSGLTILKYSGDIAKLVSSLEVADK